MLCELSQFSAHSFLCYLRTVWV